MQPTKASPRFETKAEIKAEKSGIKNFFSFKTRKNENTDNAKKTVDDRVENNVKSKDNKSKKKENSLKSPRLVKTTTIRRQKTPTEADLKHFIHEHTGATDGMKDLWCLRPEALKEDLDNKSEALRDAELLLRNVHKSLITTESRLRDPYEQSPIKGLAADLFNSSPFKDTPELDIIRNELDRHTGRAGSLATVAKIYEDLIVQVASLRDADYGNDLQMVTHLITFRDHLRRAVGVTYRTLTVDEIKASNKIISNLITSAFKESPAISYINKLFKTFNGYCNFETTARNEDNTKNYRDALVNFLQDLGKCVPAKMRPPSTMSKTERDTWINKAMQIMVAPLRGLGDRDALEKAFTAMADQNIDDVKNIHAIASGSFRAIGLVTLGAASISKALPESENSEVRSAVDALLAALPEHAAMLKTYSGAESASTPDAVKNFDAVKYKAAVDALWSLSVEVFRAAGITQTDVENYIEKQKESVSATAEQTAADGTVLFRLVNQ